MAKAVGCSRVSWENYEGGKSAPGFAIVQAIGDLGIDLNWLATGEGAMQREPAMHAAAAELYGTNRRRAEAAAEARPDLDALRRQVAAIGNGFVMVPRYDVEASAGPGALTSEENVIDYMAFQAGWVRRALGVDPNCLALISAKGDSMEPTIRAGDLLLIDTGVNQVEDDAIYIIVLDGHLMVKRLQRFIGGVVSVKSDNAAYVEQTLSADELAAYAVIAGRVRWIGRLT